MKYLWEMTQEELEERQDGYLCLDSMQELSEHQAAELEVIEKELSRRQKTTDVTPDDSQLLAAYEGMPVFAETIKRNGKTFIRFRKTAPKVL